jgi:hypothetical protein
MTRMSPLEKLHFGKKSLGLWLTITNDHGSLIKAFNPSEAHTAHEHYPREDFLSENESLQYFYHSHRDTGEHGHIHIFHRDHTTRNTNHLLAIGLSEKGLPVSLFIVNEESVSEKSPGAQTLQQLLKKSLKSSVNETTLTTWIISFCRFYKDNIINLMAQASSSPTKETTRSDILEFTTLNWEEDLERCEKDALINKSKQQLVFEELRPENLTHNVREKSH